MSLDIIPIQSGAKVTMHFSLQLADGSIADSTKVNNLPGTVIIGDGTLSKAFEQELAGLSAGDEKTFTLEAEDAFGKASAENVYILPHAQFDKDMNLQAGLIVEFEQANGSVLPGIIRKIDEEGVVVDFNHPLAGQTITFNVEILQVDV